MSIAMSNYWQVLVSSPPQAEKRRPAPARQSQLMVGIDRQTERKWKASIDGLLKLRAFNEDWDGEGAAKPFPEIIDSVIAWFNSEDRDAMIPAAPDRILPRPDGTISLEWFFQGGHLITRVHSPGSARCIYLSPEKPESFFSWNWMVRQDKDEITWSETP